MTLLSAYTLSTGIKDVAISPNSKWGCVRAGAAPDGIAFFDMPSGALIKVFPTSTINDVEDLIEFSPNSQRVVVTGGAGAGTVNIFDISGAVPVLLATYGLSTSADDLTVSSDNRFAAVRGGAAPDGITVFNLSDGSPNSVFLTTTAGGNYPYPNTCDRIAFSADAQRLVSIGGAGTGSVDVFNTSGAVPVPLATYGFSTAPAHLALSSDSHYCVIRSGTAADSIAFIDIISGALLSLYPSTSGDVCPCNLTRFSSDNNNAVVIGGAGQHSVDIFAKSGNNFLLTATNSLSTSPLDLAISSDNRLVAVRAGAAPDGIATFNLIAGTLNSVFATKTGSDARDLIAFSQNNQRLVTIGGAGQNSIDIFNSAGITPSYLLTMGLATARKDIAISSDNNWALTRGGASPDAIGFFDLNTLIPTFFPSSYNTAYAIDLVDFSPDNTRAIVTAGGLPCLPTPTPTPTPTVTPTPTPPPQRSITVLNLDDNSGNPLPGWQMILHSGGGCNGPALQGDSTNNKGMVDFPGLNDGSYSVEEVLQAGWTPVTGACQDVFLNSNRPSGSVSGLDYPPAGDDTFPSGAHFTIDITGVGSDNVTLNGPTTIHRGNPCVGCGPGGRTTIDTEMVQLDLTGNSGPLGPITMRRAPSPPSQGQTTQQTPGVDFPANSLFDLFFELQTTGDTLHNTQPLQMQGMIDELPPINDPYFMYEPPVTGIPLYNSSGQQVGFIRYGVYIPLPPGEILIVFRNRPPATPTPTPTMSPTPTVTPSPTPALVSISGTVTHCSNPVPGPVPNVTMTLTGTATGTTTTDALGSYTFTSLFSGSYTVTPTKTALAPGATGISTTDVIATQRHFLTLGTPLSGCRLTAADVNGSGGVTTTDVIAIQRFFLHQTTGIANVGKYKFTPASRSYTGLTSSQTGQNYDTLVFGDVVAGFVHRPEGSSQGD